MSEPFEAAHSAIEDLSGLIPDDSFKALQWVEREAAEQRAIAQGLAKELRDLRLALDMYEREAGEGSILFRQNLNICLDQVRRGNR